MRDSKKQTAKRVLCYLMTLVMLLTSTPFVAMAAEGREQAREVRQVADELRPLTDIPGMTTIKVKHLFQSRKDPKRYAEKYGDTKIITTTQQAVAGTRVEIQPLPVSEREGYVPQKNVITVHVPKTIGNFVVEYRYNRASFDAIFDSAGGTGIPALHLYTGQVIPLWYVGKPEKTGATFEGWKPNQDLQYMDKTGTHTIKKGTVITEKDFPDGIPEAMPAKAISFTAAWKEKPKANYTIQYWTEKADSDGYDYVGAKVVKDAPTGSQPNLNDMTPEGITFPEVGAVKKETPGKFTVTLEYKDPVTEEKKEAVRDLERYYTRNTAKIEQENKVPVDPAKPTGSQEVKKVDSTGNTVYNIYYDRQEYTMLFEKNTGEEFDGYPEREARLKVPQADGWKQYDSDPKSPDAPNTPYQFTAKFGERMKKWPNDLWVIAPGTGIKFSPRTSFHGWLRNGDATWPVYNDTPPYWLSSELFIDRPEIDDFTPVTESTSNGKTLSERTLSFGPSESQNDRINFSIYYMEYAFQDLDGSTKRSVNPDMSYMKVDTDYAGYLYPAPNIPGFEPTKSHFAVKDGSSPVDLDGEELTSKTPKAVLEELWGKESNRPANKRSHFWTIGLSDDGTQEDKGINEVPFKDLDQYTLTFTYDRNQYRLQLDSDPRDINEDSYFDGKTFTNSKSAVIPKVYYEKPLIDLKLDTDYKLDKKDKPEGYPDDYEFKGWAVDPAGTQRIHDQTRQQKVDELKAKINATYEALSQAKTLTDIEQIRLKIRELQTELDATDVTMPYFNKTVYAQWGEPDYKWKVKFDPNGGALSDIKDTDIATAKAGDPITTTAGRHGPQKYVMPVKESNEGDKQVFTVSHRMSIKPPKAPTRVGYDFMGWEFVRYDENGKVDNYFANEFKLPELYAYGNEVVSDLHLRAIWNKNPGADIRDVKPMPVGLLDTTQELHYFAHKSIDVQTEGVLYAQSILAVNPYAPIECAVLPATDKMKAENNIAA